MAGGNSGPGWRGASRGKATPANPNWRKAPPDAAAGTSRTVKLLALGGCAVAVLIGVVVMLQILKKPQRAGLVTLAGDPASAGRLDVPYDPAGWLSAARLLDAVAGNPDAKAIGPVPGGDRPFALDEDRWLDAVGQDAKVDPVVVYVGLAGGVNRQGEAVLHPGRADRPPVRLAEFLDKLKAAASAKRVVVVLDVGRQAADPNLGEARADFARAVQEDKALAEQLAKSPAVALLLAAGDESRAWDSPERGLTMLAYALRNGLLGGAGRPNYTSFGVLELVKTVTAEVKRTSENERPAAQVPLLLPPAAEWAEGGERARLFAERPFYQPVAPKFPEFAAAADAPPALAEFWDEQQKLASPSARPAPAVYTPAAWRRYRELGLRFEQSVVAGDAEGQAVLAAALKVEKERIEAGTGVLLAASGLHALPLRAALGQPAPAAAGWAASFQASSSLPAFAKKLQDTAEFKVRPPTEVHLPLMLHHYATEVVPAGTAPRLDAWKPAAACRRLAEQAALSSPDGSGFPYSERLWPAVRGAVLAADEARRRGEDRMLTDAPDDKSKSAAQEFEEARAGYQAATDRGGLIQRALAARDGAFADLPFLGRWAGEVEGLTDPAADPAALSAEVEAAWRATHALAEAIEKALPSGEAKALAPLAAATQKATALMQRLRDLAAAEARVTDRKPTQTNWLRLQHLATLPVPLATPADRAANYRAGRGLAEGFRKTDGQVGDKAPPAAGKATPAAAEAARATRRLKTLAASLGGGHGDWAADRTLATPRDSGEVAGLALAHRLGEANFAAHDRPDEAEALSRLAAPYRPTEEYEPAAANARRRWAALLDGLARRAAFDHWFDEASQPYLTRFAQDYLDDAERLRDPAKPAPQSADAADAAKLIAAARAAEWRYEPAATDRLSDWTTETDNRFTYRFELGGYDKLLPAEAAVWAGLSGGDLLVLDEPSTRPRPVSWQSEPGKRSAEVNAACGVPLERRSGETKLTATAYFRGRKVPQEQVIAFNGRPHVVQSDLQPPPGAAVAVRADVDPGAVAVVVDYSGSMTEKWAGGGKSKKDIVVALMRELLPKLPPGTRLSIRLMREDAATKAESRLIYSSAGPLGVNGLTKNDFDAVMDSLTGTAPDGLTPLVRTMKLAAQEDFPKPFAGVQTLIVVTDGADTSHIERVPQPPPPAGGGRPTVNDVFRFPGNPAKLTRLVNDDVEREFKGIAASIQMVVFGADQDELDLAQAMFRPLEDFDDRNRGRVIVARDEVSLRQELLEALRPRVKLLVGNQAVRKGKPPNDVPRIGVPADQAAGTDAVIWRGRLDAQSYALKYLNSRAELQLGRGDAVAVRLRKAEGDLKYEFERESYYRDVLGKSAKKPGDRAAESGAFFAHVPNYGVRNPGSELSYLAAVASVDRVGTSLKPGRDGGALSLANPHGLWWEVRRTPAGAKEEARYDKPLSVWNAFGLAAPSWRLVTDGVRDSAELSKGTPFRLAVWPLEQQPNSLGRVSFSNSDLTAGDSKTLGGVRVRARLEEVAFLGSKYPSAAGQGPFPAALAAKQRCLVLRVDGDKAGRLLRAKVAWENDTSVAARQHLYYFRDPRQTAEKAEVKAYTVIVGPVTEDFVAGKQGAEVELLDLGEALRQTPTRRLDIDLGRPPEDDRAPLDTLPFSLEP